MNAGTRPIKARWWSPAWQYGGEWRDYTSVDVVVTLRQARKVWEGTVCTVVPHRTWMWVAKHDETQRPFFLVAE